MENFDPTISAFNIMSDRLHDVEDKIDLVLHGLKMTNMTQNGWLDNKLFGYNFPVQRVKVEDDEDVNESPFLNAAEVYITAKIGCGCGYDFLNFLSGAFDANIEHKISQEYTSLGDNRFSQECQHYGIDATHDGIWDEIVQRKFDKLLNRNMFDMVTLADYDLSMSILLRAEKSCVSVEDYICEAINLFEHTNSSGCTKRCIERIDVTPIRPIFVDIIPLLNGLQSYEADDRKKAELKEELRRRMSRYDERGLMKYVKSHPYFKYDPTVRYIQEAL